MRWRLQRKPDRGYRGLHCPCARPAGLLLRLRRAGRPRAQPAHAYPGAAPDHGRVPGHDQDGPGDRVLGDILRLAPAHPAWAEPGERAPPGARRRWLRAAGDAAPAHGRGLGQPDREADPRRGLRGGQGPGRGATPAASLLSHLVHRLCAAGGGHVQRRPRSAGAVGVAATTQTAARFGMHPGSRRCWPPRPARHPVRHRHCAADLRQAGSTFWQQDATPVKPTLEQVNPNSPLFWAGGVIADPDQFRAFLRARSAAPVSRCSWSSRSTPAA